MAHATEVQLTDEQAALLARTESQLIEASQHYEMARAKWAAAVRSTSSSDELQPIAVDAAQGEYLHARERLETLKLERDQLRERLHAERALELRLQALASVVADQELRHHDAKRLADAHAANGRRGFFGRLFGRKH